MKIVFFCIPAHGHTNPTLGVVRELIARGHEVWYYSYESMREKIEPAGAHFISCDAFDPQMSLRPEDSARVGKDLLFSMRLIVQLTLALDDAVLADMQALQPDVIVGDSMAYWAKLIAGKLGVPFVSSTTTFAFNKESAKVIGQSGSEALKLLLQIPKINRSLAPLREKGYPVKSFLDIISNGNDTDTIVYTSRLFQPCAETFSDHYAFVGPSMRPAEESAEKAEIPTVFISLGTVDNQHPDFYRSCIAAFSESPYQVIMAVGEETDIAALGDIPTRFTVVPRVDQMAVLQAADVFITHCGMNSASEALYHSIPLVLFPQTPEQRGVANRVQELGAGVMLSGDSPAAIRCAVDTALTEPSYRRGAQAIADSFHTCGGAKAAADKIVDTAQKPATPFTPQQMMTRWQKAQALVGTAALVLLAVAFAFHGAVRTGILVVGAVLGTGSNVLRLFDRKKKQQP